MNREEIEHLFTYHPPQDDQPIRYEVIRENAKVFASKINDMVPECPEKAYAIAKIREAVMWANAGIVCRNRTHRRG